jgi:hypothetical protein
MAFPSQRDTSTGVETSNTTAWDVSAPTTVVAGDLLLLTIGCDGSGVTFSNFSTGWGFVKTLSDGSCSLNIWAKVADGTEGGTLIGTGAGSTITSSASEQGPWRMSSIQDWWGSLSGIAVSTGVTGASDSPDPDTLTAPWGVGETLWRAIGASDFSVTVSAYPTDYDLNQFNDISGGGNGAGVFAAGRAYSATDTQDPGVFTLSGSDGWAAVTVAIRSAPVTASAYHLGA